jgi:L-iditol 2-dehydrogenase
MKVARLYSFDDIRVEDMPVPECGPGEAVVKVRASGICSGDAMPWYIERKAPLVLGHEPAGEIVEVGEGVEKFRPGDRVFVHHHAPCMECAFCRRGDFVQCATWRSSTIDPGGIAEYLRVPAVNLQRDTLLLPDEVSFEDATLVEPLACVVKSLRRSGMQPGDTVFVIGLGVMGMMHLMLAREFGAGRVIGADMVPYRLEAAYRLGADETIDVSDGSSLSGRLNDMTGGRGAEIVIVGPNSAAAMSEGIRCAAPGGTVVFFTPALPDEMLRIDPNYIYFNDISLVTSYSCGPDDTRAALEYIRKGVVTSDSLVTHRYGIEDIGEAYGKVVEARDSLKVIVEFR